MSKFRVLLENNLHYNRIIFCKNIDKSNNYAHFATDITHINTAVTAFEISSTGNVSSDNIRF